MLAASAPALMRRCSPSCGSARTAGSGPPPFATIPPRERTRGLRWVQPRLVAQIDFGGWTERGDPSASFVSGPPRGQAGRGRRPAGIIASGKTTLFPQPAHETNQTPQRPPSHKSPRQPAKPAAPPCRRPARAAHESRSRSVPGNGPDQARPRPNTTHRSPSGSCRTWPAAR